MLVIHFMFVQRCVFRVSSSGVVGVVFPPIAPIRALYLACFSWVFRLFCSAVRCLAPMVRIFRYPQMDFAKCFLLPLWVFLRRMRV